MNGRLYLIIHIPCSHVTLENRIRFSFRSKAFTDKLKHESEEIDYPQKLPSKENDKIENEKNKNKRD